MCLPDTIACRKFIPASKPPLLRYALQLSGFDAGNTASEKLRSVLFDIANASASEQKELWICAANGITPSDI